MERLTHIFVVINGCNYPCTNILQAVDKCYQALKALRTFPPLLEHVWIFIEKLVFRIQSKEEFTAVDTVYRAIIQDLKIEDKCVKDY